MEFRYLKTFETVVSYMSFNRAAEVLHCTQSTVSSQIKSLETDLGRPVFERLGRRIALTPAGEELLHHTRRLLEYERSILAAVREREETTGLISLRVPQSAAVTYLPEILTRFNRDHPKVGFDISNCGYFRLTDEMKAGKIDGALLLANEMDAVELHTTVLRTETLVYVANPNTNLAFRKSLTLTDLTGQTLLIPKHDCGYRMSLERSLKEAAVEVAAIIEMNSLAAIIQCLIKGLGVALIPERAVADDIVSGRLVTLDWQAPIQTDLLFLRHRDKPLIGVFGAFVETVISYFQSLD